MLNEEKIELMTSETYALCVSIARLYLRKKLCVSATICDYSKRQRKEEEPQTNWR